MSRHSRAILLSAVALLAARAAAQSPKDVPPGVRLLQRPPAANALDVSVVVHAIEVDWTSPWLRARLVSGIESSDRLPAAWNAFEPEKLKIQLAEPIEAVDGWRPALRTSPAPSPTPPAKRDREILSAKPLEPADRDFVRVGGVTPWFFDGPTARLGGDPVSPLGEGSGGVEVRWLGHPADWESRPPEFDLTDEWIVSSLDPLTGLGHFMIVINASAKRLPAKHIAGWIGAAFPRRCWIAVHSVGVQAAIGQSGWLLGETNSSRAPATGRIPRAGSVLVLEKAQRGGEVDWARVGKPRIAASSYPPLHAPESAVSGLLWPMPLRPSVWMSQPEGNEADKLPWIELDFPLPRPVKAIRLVYAEAAGWSEHFNPAAVDVKLGTEDRAEYQETIGVAKIDGPATTIRFAEPRALRRIRVEVPIRSRTGDPRAPARLAAVQALGEWDGGAAE